MTVLKKILLGECDRRAVPGSRHKYERHVYYQSHAGVAGRIQQEWMLQECSPGTEFHPEVCDCRVSGDPAALNKRNHGEWLKCKTQIKLVPIKPTTDIMIFISYSLQSSFHPRKWPVVIVHYYLLYVNDILSDRIVTEFVPLRYIYIIKFVCIHVVL